MNTIPKQLHLYWDRSPMSMLQVYTITSFHKLNPDWDINVYIAYSDIKSEFNYIPDYTGDNYFHLIAKLNYVYVSIVDLKKYNINNKLHNILKSDVFRYNILYDIGGVWCDFDVLWLKPIDSLTETGAESLVSFYNTTYGFHSIGIMMSTVGGKYMKSLIDECDRILKNLNLDVRPGHQIFGSTMLNRMYPTYDDIKIENIDAIKQETFYPYSIFNLDALYNKTDLSFINDNVLCVHWFNGHKLSKDFVNNGMKKECSMKKLIELCQI